MKNVLISIIKFYRKHISPKLPPMCKFYPTCSEYGIIAIERFGPLKGSLLTLWRIIRCSPLTSGGYDPVPEKKVK
ncbi:MAG: membrane protein insertion efficiency factor YidD [Clostridia bacterium]|nr:membrane protein insertion efficiency factor YidD [Clostridia bacterium]